MFFEFINPDDIHGTPSPGIEPGCQVNGEDFQSSRVPLSQDGINSQLNSEIWCFKAF